MKRSFFPLLVAAAVAPMLAACSSAPPLDDERTGISESALVGVGTLRSSAGFCLDVQWGKTAPGTPVQLFDCNGTNAQNWQFTGGGELRALGNNCVRAPTTTGGPLTIQPCDGSAAQTWTLSALGEVRGAGGSCIAPGVQAKWQLVGVATCSGGPEQRWVTTGFAPDPTPATTCTAADLVNGSGSGWCAGGFTYRDFVSPCYAKLPNPLCGMESCQVQGTCESPTFGLDHESTFYWGQVAVTPDSYVEEDCPPPALAPGGIHTMAPVCTHHTEYDYDAPCSHRAAAVLADVVHQHNPLGYPPATYSYQIGASTGAGHDKFCQITLKKVPVYKSLAASPCPLVPGTCASSCRNGPTLDPDPKACGEDGTTTHLSGAGMTAAQIARLDTGYSPGTTPACTTCDDLPATTPAQIVAKGNCMKANVPVYASQGGVAAARALDTLVPNAKLLLELNEAALDTNLQSFVLDLYQQYPDKARGCNATWTRPASPPTCNPAEERAAAQSFDFCGELAEAGITAEARAPYIAYCTLLDIQQAGIYNCDGYANIYSDILTRLNGAGLSKPGNPGADPRSLDAIRTALARVAAHQPAR